MSEELTRQGPAGRIMRKLRAEEISFIRALIDNFEQYKNLRLDSKNVVEMSDEGMGSLLFISKDGKHERQLGRRLMEAEFVDQDGVLVSVVVNVDADGDLYELDLWKVDFSKLRKLPPPEKISLKPPV